MAEKPDREAAATAGAGSSAAARDLRDAVDAFATMVRSLGKRELTDEHEDLLDTYQKIAQILGRWPVLGNQGTASRFDSKE